MPSLWAFLRFNVASEDMASDEPMKELSDANAAEVAEEKSEQTGAEIGSTIGAETGAEQTDSLLASLEPAEWHYPDDCYYIKMYVLCPLRCLEDAFGPAHNAPDARRFFLFRLLRRSRTQRVDVPFRGR